MEDQRNFFTALLLSAIVLIGYWFVFAKPMAEEARRQADLEQAAVAEAIPTPPVPTAEVATLPESLRIPIRTPAVEGSFQLRGTRFDDLKLLDYRATLDADSPEVTLLYPEAGDSYAAYVFDGWTVRDGGTGADAEWELVSGEALSPATPVRIRHKGQGFSVDRTVSIDDRYLITLSDTVTNTSGAPVVLERHGASRQHGLPEGLTNFFILQEGPIAVVDGELFDMKYKKLTKERRASRAGESGWAGLTDKYWLAAAIAPTDGVMEAEFDYSNVNNQPVYEASYTLDPVTLTPGSSIESVGYVFAGAKERDVLERYESEFGIDQLDLAIDWGLMGILVRPMTTVLNWLGETIGNYGVAIMVLTLLIKIVLFPLFNKQYASMAKMKKVAPELTRLREVYGDDRMKLQQEMMALYKKEGVNPMAGCLPIIPTIFVFFALYKTVFIDVDLRHEPFFGWIQDLSAPDPLSILNLFGILPWGPNPIGIAFLAIGPLAILYGITMAMMQTLSTPGGDPMQRKIFAAMPWVFMFILAPFATGLLVYWVWNNVLSFAQQYVITRKHKVDTPFDRLFRKLTGRNRDLPDGVEVIEPGE